MKRKTLVPRQLPLVLALVAGLAYGGGVVSQVPPVATIHAEPGLLRWIPNVESAGIELAVMDPSGAVRSFRFAPTELPALSLLDADGGPLPDGTYTWELRLTTREGVYRRGPGKAWRAAAPRAVSGYFTITAGNLVAPDLPEPPEPPEPRQRQAPTPASLTAKAQVVPDDLIVDGKGCVGLGCAANETFGQEALRLKQSVVRLRFEDTSTQPGFPPADWQLTANDAASGGANRFSLEDLTATTTPFTIRGGAPNSSLYVDPAGNVGLGTAVPAQRFHLVGSSTPTLRLEQSGGTPRTWDLSANHSSFRLVDVTNSSAVPVQVAAGAPTNSLVVGPTGYVGIGVNPPTAPFHLVANLPSDVTGRVRNTSSTGYSGIEFLNHTGLAVFFFGVDNGGGFTRLNSIQNFPLVLLTESQPRLRIQSNGYIALGNLPVMTLVSHPLQHANGAHLTTGGVWTNASSRHFKQDIHDLDSRAAFAALEGLKPVEFAYKADPAERHVGFIAEDVPDLVAEDVPDLVAENGREGLSPMDVVAVLTRVVQDQQKEIEAQKELVRQLAERLAALDGKR